MNGVISKTLITILFVVSAVTGLVLYGNNVVQYGLGPYLMYLSAGTVVIFVAMCVMMNKLSYS